MSPTQRRIPLMHHGRKVGEAVVEADADGARVLSTSFTDPEVKARFEADILRMSIVPEDKEK